MKEKLLIVNRNQDGGKKLYAMLQKGGFSCLEVKNIPEVLEILGKDQANLFSLLVADVSTFNEESVDQLLQVRKLHAQVGMVVVSAEQEIIYAVKVMRKGALDFIVKPIQADLLIPRIQRALERVHLEKENLNYQHYLEEKIDDRTADLVRKHQRLQRLYINTIEAIARAIEAKDAYTQGHSKRVSRYCSYIAEKLGVDHEDLQDIEIAGLLHDVGKIGISDAILEKSTRLTIEEYETIKEHPLISLKIIEPIAEFRKVKGYVKHHHEKWDGNGYPDQLKEQQIPLGARILAVADAFDTMWIGRHYHAAWDLNVVIREFQRSKATQFDPKVVDAFVELIQGDKKIFDQIRKEYPPRFGERTHLVAAEKKLA